MTKKELGKLRYDRHYANVKARLISKYRTRPSDVDPHLMRKVFFVQTMDQIQAQLDEHYATYGRIPYELYTQATPNAER